MTIRCTHRVGLLLTGLLLVTLALPFVTYAPNRLLSGEGRGLWQALPWLAGVQLAAALAGMPEQTQEEIFLYYLQHLTQKEIGEQSGWTRSTIGRHSQLALKRLKEEMEVLSYE